jgi:putative peptidoglycan lipid II flippase
MAMLVGLVYSVLQVRFFGASRKVDAFFVAMTALNVVTSLIQGGQVAEAFLPEYLKQKKIYGPHAAHRLLSTVLNRMILFTAMVLILLYFMAPFIIGLLGPGLESNYKLLSTNLFSLSLLLILFSLTTYFIQTALNAEQVYGRVELTGLINGTVSIILLVLFYKKLDIYVLVYSLLAGKIIEFLIGLYFLKRIGFQYNFLWKADNYKLKDFFKVMFSSSGYVGATQINIAVMTAMASFLPAGTLSIFNYVQQLNTKANGIIMGPVSTVFFSQFSNNVALGKQNLVSYMKKPISGVFVVTFIVCCFIALVGKDLLHFLWSKKSLSAQEFTIAYWMLFLNFFGSIFSTTGTIYRKAAISLGNAKAWYQNGIFAQLFLAVYSFFSIYYFGIFGLATIIILHKLLMTLISFLISERSGVKSSKMIYEMLSAKKFIIFSVFLLIGTLVLLLGFNMLELPTINNIIIKSFLLVVIIFSLLLNLYKVEMKDLLFSFRKK